MRTTSNVTAVDFQTGKRIWQTEDEKEPKEPIPNRWNAVLAGGNAGMIRQQVLYGREIWEDAIYGTLSSDGNLVFVIEELPRAVGLQNIGTMIGGRNNPSNQSNANALAAYDIQTGKLQWKVGGEESSEQNDTFFLGPPLPLRGQLYAMAESKGEIRLLALGVATGKLLWSQRLALVESDVSQDWPAAWQAFRRPTATEC